MFAVKVFHGYIAKDGKRTRNKNPQILLTFSCKEHAQKFANQIGGRVKQIG
ncbi:hypothetical protein RV11_GL001176 [Enterococcus phoeniculicola]|jgi:hypothetical protein|uniref:Uncharacterized protein n=1 Tax=Enterococcus phoeniculicola ATCC BAA-412 TaxID=1158610 RepID=R3TY78_9ENTE|nr:hypothetical protein [Enterococcus phoeniculicola]EOL46098.1 hypothetical protein UC3_00903 [Enterococcus phoeniculicola ATCC BAA-412]EOT77057.1 hypothetical protein I589_02019 [Enterococcus phoeniculicola ATCC BAA-412]OJG73396.1 hypothetical protein RV11_GL001176 [Enterococcus phoeniculicola]